MAVKLKVGRVGWLFLVLVAGSSPAFSQISHRSALVNIALSCIESVLPEPSTVQLKGSDRSMVVAPGVEEGLLSQGFSLSTDAGQIRLIYDVEHALVELERASNNQLTRRVSLGLNYQLLGSGDGEQALTNVLNAGTCADSKSDLIDRNSAAELAFEGFSVTSPVIPPKNGFTRYFKPVILIAASAVGTYLFFNLRSRRADGG